MAEEKGPEMMPPPYGYPAPGDDKATAAGYPPQTGYPPAGYPSQPYPSVQSYPPQPYPAQPPPQTVTQQSTSNNVVVVGQPAPTALKVELPPKASDFMIFSIVLMVLCFVHGNIPFLLLTIPALICSVVAHDYNNGGNYESAKQCGYMALGCNIAVIASYAVTILIIIITVSVVVSSAAAAVSSATSCSYRCTYYGGCSYRCT